MPRRVPYTVAIERVALAVRLGGTPWAVAGTPPLGIDVETSDIDILCQAQDLERFAGLLWSAFSHFENFAIWQWVGDGRNLVARFQADDWMFEIFAGTQSIEEQTARRHFVAEQRLLEIGGPPFRDAIMVLRRQGMKTEPAFAKALRWVGDPYAAMLAAYDDTDSELAQRLISAGFEPYDTTGIPDISRQKACHLQS